MDKVFALQRYHAGQVKARYASRHFPSSSPLPSAINQLLQIKPEWHPFSTSVDLFLALLAALDEAFSDAYPLFERSVKEGLLQTEAQAMEDNRVRLHSGHTLGGIWRQCLAMFSTHSRKIGKIDRRVKELRIEILPAVKNVNVHSRPVDRHTILVCSPGEHPALIH